MMLEEDRYMFLPLVIHIAHARFSPLRDSLHAYSPCIPSSRFYGYGCSMVFYQSCLKSGRKLLLALGPAVILNFFSLFQIQLPTTNISRFNIPFVFAVTGGTITGRPTGTGTGSGGGSVLYGDGSSPSVEEKRRKGEDCRLGMYISTCNISDRY